MLSRIFIGILKETRVVLLYSIPATLLIFGLHMYGLTSTLLPVFITSTVFVFVIAIEDRHTMDEEYKLFMVRLGTVLGIYYIIKSSNPYILGDTKLTEAFKTEDMRFQHNLLLQEFTLFMESISLFRIYFISFISLLYIIASIISTVIPI